MYIVIPTPPSRSVSSFRLTRKSKIYSFDFYRVSQSLATLAARSPSQPITVLHDSFPTIKFLYGRDPCNNRILSKWLHLVHYIHVRHFLLDDTASA